MTGLPSPGAPLVAPGRDWEAMRAAFRWPRPDRFNIFDAVCGRWARAEPDRLALRVLRPDDETRDWRYGELDRASARLANALAARGLTRGERVGLLLPQTQEALLTHLACYRLGAIVVPLFTLFGEDGLRYRLADSGAAMVVTDADNLPKILNIRDDLPELGAIWSVDRPTDGAWGFWPELAKASDRQTPAETSPDDPAFISYTSGTTGPPKGALHAHRVLLGHMPGFETHHDFAPRPGDLFWTPADWAWLGGLADALLPSLFHGIPILAHRMPRFDPERAFDILARHGVRNAFMPPTALRLMAQVPDPASRGVSMRSIGSGGEALGEALLDWGREALGLTINEFYGQTECNLVLGNCAAVFPPRPGSTGRAVPGHEVAVIDSQGNALPDGETGEIAVLAPDPVMFLGYWNKPEKTEEKFVAAPDGRRWLRTGDEGRREPDGHFFFASRTDDVITSSGYRIGPSEIEDCLAGHPAVAMAAVVGLPDPVRTEAVTAVLTLAEGAALTDALKSELTDRVRDRLGPHVAPRDIRATGELPLTATGKIMRREVKRRLMEDG
ncbi:MAG: AMP-binding protein [Pseudomonadota bacterium]